MGVSRLLVVIEAVLLLNVACTFLDDEVQPLDAADGTLYKPAMEASLMETQPGLVESTPAATKVASGTLSLQDKRLLQRAAEDDLVDTASTDVAMAGRVRAQVLEAMENRQKGAVARADANKLIGEDNRRLSDLQATVNAKEHELQLAERNAPHLKLLELGESMSSSQAPGEAAEDESSQPETQAADESAQEESKEQTDEESEAPADDKTEQKDEEPDEESEKKDEDSQEPDEATQARENGADQEEEANAKKKEDDPEEASAKKKADDAEKALKDKAAVMKKAKLKTAHEKIDDALQSNPLIKEKMKAAEEAVKNASGNFEEMPALAKMKETASELRNKHNEEEEKAANRLGNSEKEAAASAKSLEEANKRLKEFQDVYETSAKESKTQNQRAKLLEEESVKARADWKKPHAAFVANATKTILAHVAKYTKMAEDSKARSSEAKQKYLEADAKDPRHENVYKQILVEETKNGLKASLSKAEKLALDTATPLFSEKDIAKTREREPVATAPGNSTKENADAEQEDKKEEAEVAKESAKEGSEAAPEAETAKAEAAKHEAQAKLAKAEAEVAQQKEEASSKDEKKADAAAVADKDKEDKKAEAEVAKESAKEGSEAAPEAEAAKAVQEIDFPRRHHKSDSARKLEKAKAEAMSMDEKNAAREASEDVEDKVDQMQELEQKKTEDKVESEQDDGQDEAGQEPAADVDTARVAPDDEASAHGVGDRNKEAP